MPSAQFKFWTQRLYIERRLQMSDREKPGRLKLQGMVWSYRRAQHWYWPREALPTSFRCGVIENQRNYDKGIDQRVIVRSTNSGNEFGIIGPMYWHFVQSYYTCLSVANTMIYRCVKQQVENMHDVSNTNRRPIGVVSAFYMYISTWNSSYFW